MNVFKGRWGYYPCSYETFKKIKFLNTVYLQALQMAARWRRWKRKDVKNRVVRKRIRDKDGSVIGYEPPVEWPEPAICEVFSEKKKLHQHWDKNGNFYKDGFLDDVVKTWPDMFAISRHARYPASNEEAVKPLKLTDQEINDLYDRAKS